MILKQILAILSAILGIFLLGFSKGKKSTEIKENENASKQIRKRNETIDKVHQLDDSELDSLVQKFTKTNK